MKTDFNIVELAGTESIYKELARLVVSGKPIKQIIKTILAYVEKSTKASKILLYTTENAAKGFVSFSNHGGKKRKFDAGLRVGLASEAIIEKKNLLVADAKKSPAYSKRVDLSVTKKEKAIAAFPLFMDNNPVGVIELRSASFSEYDLEFLQTMVNFLSIACSHARSIKKIEEITIRDSLTGLFNAKCFKKMIEMEARRSERYEGIFSIIFIDVDNFKLVNDKHGHLVGSRTLREIGKLFVSALRTDIDSGFRYGGDEFVLLLPNTDRVGAVVVARRLQYLLNSRNFRNDKGVIFNITASFGIASFPQDAQTGEDIIRFADSAMYKVKDLGRDGICSSADGVSSF